MYRATAPYFSSVIRCFSTDTRPAPWPYSEFTWATSRPWTRRVSKNWGPTHSTQSTASICWFVAWSIEGLFGSSNTTWKWSDPGLWASHPKHIVLISSHLPSKIPQKCCLNGQVIYNWWDFPTSHDRRVPRLNHPLAFAPQKTSNLRVTSSIPMVNPRFINHRLVSLAMRLMQSMADCAPQSRMSPE